MLFSKHIICIYIFSICMGQNLLAEAKTVKFEISFKKGCPKIFNLFRTQGKSVEQFSWKDKKGIHCLQMSEDFQKEKADPHSGEDDGSTTFLYISHYQLSDNGQLSTVRQVKDFVKDCTLDTTLAYVENSFIVTDLNKNQIFEHTYMYHQQCAGDVSAPAMKLLMFEGKVKYALRGGATSQYYPKDNPGFMKVGPEFKKAPKRFLKWAKNHWKKHD